jgi:hypothetical protein
LPSSLGQTGADPLAYVDPNGFKPGVVGQPGFLDVALPDDHIVASPEFQLAR